MKYSSILARYLLLAWSACLPISRSGAAEPEAAWQHPPSPYRAVFTVKRHPSQRDAGYWLRVPVCGLGDPAGLNVYAFDHLHRPLKLQALGPSDGHTALVLVGHEQELSTIYAYWGSSRRAPQNQTMETGLRVFVRQLPDKPDLSSLKSCQEVLGRSRVIAVLPQRTINWAGNPLTLDDNLVLEFRGYFQRPRGEKPSLFLVHDGAGFLEVDGKVVVEHPGSHNPNAMRQGEGRLDVPLNQGLTPFAFLVFSPGRNTVAALARYEDARRKAILSEDWFALSGETELTKVQGQYEATVCPAFWSRQSSYMGIETTMYTRVDFGTHSGQAVEWRFGDGGRARGAKASTIRVGTSPFAVQAGVAGAREVASGTVHFATVPVQYRMDNPRHYAEYAEVMLAQELPRLDAPTLLGYYAFLSLRERNPDLVPVCEALVASPYAREAGKERAVYLSLARGAAMQLPDQALAAYNELLRQTREPAIVNEYLEFLLYRQGDLAGATKAIERAASLFGNDDRQVIRCRAELAMLQGEADAAMAQVRRLQSYVTDREQHRSFVVRANALIERFRTHLAANAYEQAEAALRDFAIAQPDSYLDGQYALLRARHLRQIGWPAGAIAIVEGTLKLNALPAFLPDLEMQRAYALRALDRPDEARKRFQYIADTYPNHPLANEARQQAEK